MKSPSNSLLVLTGSDVKTLLCNNEALITSIIEKAYHLHGTGNSSLPHSSFLRFPEMVKERIIALPAYLGGDANVAGVKWIASFPENLKAGKSRASASIILNSMEDGRPICMMEGSIISASRTAASAALAARHLHINDQPVLGLIGCGCINLETLRFLRWAFPGMRNLHVYDINPDSIRAFSKKIEADFPDLCMNVTARAEEILSNCSLISIATTSIKPYIEKTMGIKEGAVILHISLRDIAPEVILASENVVDDVEHVCRESTSVDLAMKRTGRKWRPALTLYHFISGQASAHDLKGAVTIFSPFGLGILDIALAQKIYELARQKALGTKIEAFLPAFDT